MCSHRKLCLDAARDMITHIHRSFEIAPGLRRWSYYCFYCLQATLVLLAQTAGEISSDDLMCKRAVEVFEQIKLKASQRCAQVVRQYLRRRTKLRQKRQEEDTRTEQTTNEGFPSQVYESADQSQFTGQIAMHEAQNPDGTLTNEQGYETNAASLFNLDDSSTSWPLVSPNSLQTEMYGALYSIDPSDEFYLGHQPYFFGAGALTNDSPAIDVDDWPQF